MCSREQHEETVCSERVVTCECGAEHAISKTEDHRYVSLGSAFRGTAVLLLLA